MSTRNRVSPTKVDRSVGRSSAEHDSEPEASAQTRRLALSISEAAELLGISRSLAYELVRRGDLPAIQLGRRLVVPVVALERLVDAPHGLPREGGSHEGEWR